MTKSYHPKNPSECQILCGEWSQFACACPGVTRGQVVGMDYSITLDFLGT